MDAREVGFDLVGVEHLRDSFQFDEGIFCIPVIVVDRIRLRVTGTVRITRSPAELQESRWCSPTATEFDLGARRERRRVSNDGVSDCPVPAMT
jgi:hypothetical protein